MFAVEPVPSFKMVPAFGATSPLSTSPAAPLPRCLALEPSNHILFIGGWKSNSEFSVMSMAATGSTAGTPIASITPAKLWAFQGIAPYHHKYFRGCLLLLSGPFGGGPTQGVVWLLNAACQQKAVLPLAGILAGLTTVHDVDSLPGSMFLAVSGPGEVPRIVRIAGGKVEHLDLPDLGAAKVFRLAVDYDHWEATGEAFLTVLYGGSYVLVDATPTKSLGLVAGPTPLPVIPKSGTSGGNKLFHDLEVSGGFGYFVVNDNPPGAPGNSQDDIIVIELQTGGVVASLRTSFSGAGPQFVEALSLPRGAMPGGLVPTPCYWTGLTKAYDPDKTHTTAILPAVAAT